MRSDAASNERFDSIQVLRAVAAIAVLIRHGLQRETHLFGAVPALGFDRYLTSLGATGVDIFFVISGFVMLHAHYNMFQTPGAPADFLLRRIIRIVPIYWLLTLFAIAFFAVGAHFLAHRSGITFDLVWRSFAFLPIPKGPYEVDEPLVAQGWTLTFEMFFYLCLAGVLVLKRNWAIAVLAVGFTGLTAVGYLTHPREAWQIVLTNALLMEFLGGVLLIHGMRTGWLPRNRAAHLLALATGTGLLLWLGKPDDAAQHTARLISCGLPSILIVYGVVGLRVPASRLGRTLTTLGDASYSIYLVHIFVLAIVGRAMITLHLDRILTFWPSMAVLLTTSVLGGTGFWYLVERPITDGLRRRYGAWRRASRVAGDQPEQDNDRDRHADQP